VVLARTLFHAWRAVPWPTRLMLTCFAAAAVLMG